MHGYPTLVNRIFGCCWKKSYLRGYCDESGGYRFVLLVAVLLICVQLQGSSLVEDAGALPKVEKAHKLLCSVLTKEQRRGLMECLATERGISAAPQSVANDLLTNITQRINSIFEDYFDDMRCYRYSTSAINNVQVYVMKGALQREGSSGESLVVRCVERNTAFQYNLYAKMRLRDLFNQMMRTNEAWAKAIAIIVADMSSVSKVSKHSLAPVPDCVGTMYSISALRSPFLPDMTKGNAKDCSKNGDRRPYHSCKCRLDFV